MRAQPAEEKTKPFRLVKYFSLLSLIAVFIGILLLTVVNTHWARSMQFNKSEKYALLMVENLSYQILTQVLIPLQLKYKKIQLRQKEQYKRMDQIVRGTLHSFSVERLNIYDIGHTISYSFDEDMVGLNDVGGIGFFSALEKKTNSRLEQSGTFIENFFGFPRKTTIITFAPLLFTPQDKNLEPILLGVIEIAQDISEDYKTIFRFQIQLVAVIVGVMSTLLIVLIFVVKRGEAIIEKRAWERIRLKEQLSKAAHLSSLGEMVAGVSHEIRNPLGIIQSSAELLKKKIDKLEPDNKIPDIIVEESSRLNNIITDFLNFARPRQPDWLPCQVEQVLEKNLTFLASELEQNGYSVKTTVSPVVPTIKADSNMLYQAFLNIIINATQAMPDGGLIKIDIKNDVDKILIHFKDQGAGIPEDVLAKIWDPFFTTKEKGTGLGLGIVKNIIEAHNGAIQITGIPDQGTEVVITLPVATA
jgi:two-component system, NtrC family, sensor histidine kinase HydH